MITGVIYKYTSPDGKVYIGQTTNERARRGQFFLNTSYGGTKIDQARQEIGPENFVYEVLVKNTYADIESAKFDLDKWEAYFINEYNSVENGYNSKIGNGASIPKKINERNYSNSSSPKIKYQNHYTGSKSKWKPVLQYDLDENLIAEYNNMGDASRATGIDISMISRCCAGHAKRVRTFIFRYK